MKHSSVAIIGISNLFREGLTGLLRRSKFIVACQASTFDDALPHLSGVAPDIVVFAMPRDGDVIAHLAQIQSCREAFPAMRIVLLTDALPSDGLRDAAVAGAQAVLSNDITPEVLQRSLELVMLGQQLFPGHSDDPGPPRGTISLVPFARPAAGPAGAPDGRAGHALPPGGTKAVVHPIFGDGAGSSRAMSLSDREKQILRCLMDGAANKTIARQLAITEATVKVHIKGLLRKVRVTNRTQAAVWGLNHPDIFAGPAVPPMEPPPPEEFLDTRMAAS